MITNKQNIQNDNKDTESSVSIESKVLEMIREKKIKPRPKWFFFLIESFFWALCGILVVIASLALSIVLHIIFHSGQDELLELRMFIGDYKYVVFSVFWVFIFFIIAFLAYLNFNKTRHSHRYFVRATQIVIAVYIVLSFTFYFCISCSSLKQIVFGNIPLHSYIFGGNISVDIQDRL